ncbi:MAG: hypothetical protein ACR2JB_17785 [Bryobacteraceae bacterium]
MPTARISHETRVETIVRWAWRRSLFLLAFEQLAFALAVMFGGGILMLLLGTQILAWYWLTLLSGMTVAVSIVRARRRILTRYRIAQMVDRRLQLEDSLSTAWFLLSKQDQLDDAVSRFQIEQAEQSASSVKLASAFPFRRQLRKQRVWALAGALGAAMFGLFALRYFVHSSLSFEESLIPIHLGSVLERVEHSFSAEDHTAPYPGAAEEQPNSAQPTRSEQNYERSEAPRSQDPKVERQPDQSATPKTVADEHQPAQNGESEKSGSTDSQQRNPGDRTTEESRERANTPALDRSKDLAGRQPSSGLLEKMKDAISSLLDKMRSTQNSNKAAQNGERNADGSKTEEQSAAKNEQQGAQNAGTERARNDPSSEGGEQGQTREKAEASQGRNSDESPDKNGSGAHSGIGRQDGDKQLKEAEQLQAMGKLAEIIGKRSANLTGEVTVETSSGKQRLKTVDSQRVGQHSDLGGEINRDEIPLIYQQYVREYMERVRKQAKNNE